MNNQLRINSECTFDGETWIIRKFVSKEKILIENTESNAIKSVSKDDVSIEQERIIDRQIDLISDEDWTVAQERFSILQELDFSLSNLEEKSSEEIMGEVSVKHGISSRTLYRWKKLYDNTGLISSLAPNKSSGGRGKGRIDKKLEKVIIEIINEFHFNGLDRKVSKSYRELQKRCKKLNLEVPSQNTFRSRINLITRKDALAKRKGKSLAHQLSEPVPGTYPEVQSPMEVVQIDHTLLDIIVVNEDRKPIGRPWITVAIDIYSRMVTGLFISFDSPGTLGTGICISESILPKDQVIQQYELQSDWPIQGIISNIHSDNAPEFKSKTLQKACQEYGMNLLYRAKGKTHWGGHIERLLGNFLQEIHLIPGTTFSNPRNRREYDSEKEAILTINELEKWIYTFVVDIYHQTPHSSLGMSPLMKYYEGVYSSEEGLPSGTGVFDFDHLKLKIDFLPSIERTIQRTGVVIDHFKYYADVLSPYIYFSRSSSNLHLPKLRSPEKFIFKRDPRDLSCVYFLEPQQNKYFPVFLANKSRKRISIWEHRAALKSLKEKGKLTQVTEDSIFEAFDKLDQIVSDAKAQKRKAKSSSRNKKVSNYLSSTNQIKNTTEGEHSSGPNFDNIKLFKHSDKL